MLLTLYTMFKIFIQVLAMGEVVAVGEGGGSARAYGKPPLSIVVSQTLL